MSVLPKLTGKTTTSGTHSPDLCTLTHAAFWQMSNPTALMASTNVSFLLPLLVVFGTLPVTLQPGVLLQVWKRRTFYVPPILLLLALDCCTFVIQPKAREARAEELLASRSGSRHPSSWGTEEAGAEKSLLSSSVEGKPNGQGLATTCSKLPFSLQEVRHKGSAVGWTGWISRGTGSGTSTVLVPLPGHKLLLQHSWAQMLFNT